MTQTLTEAICAGRMCEGMTFSQRVWALTARIPAGKVATYGQIAQALNCSGSRAVGMALNRNPLAPTVPCHRVVGSDGRLVGFAQGVDRKREILESEGVEFSNGRVDVKRYACSL